MHSPNELMNQLHKAALAVKKAQETHPDHDDSYNHLATSPDEKQAAALSHPIGSSPYRTGE